MEKVPFFYFMFFNVLPLFFRLCCMQLRERADTQYKLLVPFNTKKIIQLLSWSTQKPSLWLWKYKKMTYGCLATLPKVHQFITRSKDGLWMINHFSDVNVGGSKGNFRCPFLTRWHFLILKDLLIFINQKKIHRLSITTFHDTFLLNPTTKKFIQQFWSSLYPFLRTQPA